MQFYSVTIIGMLGKESASGIRASVAIFLNVFHISTEVGMLGKETANSITPSVTTFPNVNKLAACMFVFFLVLVRAASGLVEVYKRGHKFLPNHTAGVAGSAKQTK